MDQSKEIEPTMASMEILPDEILLQIFRKQGFRHLIWISVVNSRLNRVIFELLESRLLFTGYNDMPNLSEHCIFKQVSIREGRLFSAQFKPSVLEALGRTAKTLEVDCQLVYPEMLLYVLQFFRSVVKLKLVVELFLGSDMNDATFVEQARGMFPQVRFLTISAQYYKSVGLLAAMAPTLVWLDVRVRDQLLTKFYECRFDHLRELTVRLPANQPRGFRADKLVDFLSRQKNLRKLDLDVTTEFVSWDFSKLVLIEELTLNEKVLDFCGLSRMTRLRSLRCNRCIVLAYRDTEPVPSLNKLEINSSSGVKKVEQLTRHFPNLTTLVLRKWDLEAAEMQQIVRACPSLRELSFAMSGLDATLLVPLQQLGKLRKLSVEATVENENDLAAFGGVLALESLRELHIAVAGAADEAALKKWNATLARNNPSRKIVIGKARAEEEYGDSVSIYPLDS